MSETVPDEVLVKRLSAIDDERRSILNELRRRGMLVPGERHAGLWNEIRRVIKRDGPLTSRAICEHMGFDDQANMKRLRTSLDRMVSRGELMLSEVRGPGRKRRGGLYSLPTA